jgi:hypothetical protein
MGNLGMLSALPPGMAGYVLADQQRGQRQQQQMGMLGALSQMQNAQAQQQLLPLQMERAQLEMQQVRERSERDRQIQDLIARAPELANNPLLATIARTNPGAVLPYLMPKPKGEIKLGPNETLLGPDRNPIFTAPPAPKEPNLTELEKLIAARDRMAPTDPNRRLFDLKINKLTTRDAPISINLTPPMAGMGPDGQPVFFQTPKQGGAPVIVPGVRPMKDVDGQTPENAGKIAMAQQAIDGVKTLRGLVFGNNGQPKRSLLAAMNVPGTAGMPGNEDARIAYSALRNAVEAKLRMETGAAATEPEVARTLNRFMPTPFDTKASAEFKLNELERFFSSALSQTKGIRQTPQTQGQGTGWSIQRVP